ncbi:MAG: pyridoxal-dependent decarboxylase [bacterium]
MNNDEHKQPPSAGDMPTEEFRSSGHDVIDWVSDYFDRLEELPVLPTVKPGQIKNSLPQSPPLQGQRMEEILADIDPLIMPGMTHWNHPRFFAYFTSSASSPGILADIYSAAFSVNGMIWQTGPVVTELEQVTLSWLRQMIGLPEEYWGIIYDTASISTMHAFVAAREQAGDLHIREQGMSGRTDLPKLRMYASEFAHSSIDKAAITLGFGLDGVRKIPVDDSFQMIPEALEEAIQEDRRRGIRPFCVTATVGTTSCTSIDPVPRIADICESENLWLHVDAAHGGTAAIIPEMQYILNGCNRADSLVINPHKWMAVPVDLSAFYTRKPAVLKQAFSLIPEYLRTQADSEVENLMDYGLQLGRRFRALKLWFVIRYFGWEGLAARFREHIRLAREAASWIKNDPEFELMAPVPLSTICFRAHPKDIQSETELNAFNERLMHTVNKTGKAYLSHTKLKGDYVIRLVVSHLRVREEDVRSVWHIIKEEAEKQKQSLRTK